MSFSSFFSNSASTLPTVNNWFSGTANRSSVESAQVITAESAEGRMGNMLSMLNAIGSLYSVPYLLYQKGYNYAEIAGQLNLPAGVVKSRIFTARVKMKHLITAEKVSR